MRIDRPDPGNHQLDDEMVDFSQLYIQAAVTNSFSLGQTIEM